MTFINPKLGVKSPGYINNSKDNVLKVGKILSKKYNYFSTRDIKDTGKKLMYAGKIKVIHTSSYARSGGWCVFDFSDRVLRFAKTLAKEGKFNMKKEGNKYLFSIKNEQKDLIERACVHKWRR